MPNYLYICHGEDLTTTNATGKRKLMRPTVPLDCMYINIAESNVCTIYKTYVELFKIAHDAELSKLLNTPINSELDLSLPIIGFNKRKDDFATIFQHQNYTTFG